MKTNGGWHMGSSPRAAIQILLAAIAWSGCAPASGDGACSAREVTAPGGVRCHVIECDGKAVGGSCVAR